MPIGEPTPPTVPLPTPTPDACIFADCGCIRPTGTGALLQGLEITCLPRKLTASESGVELPLGFAPVELGWTVPVEFGVPDVKLNTDGGLPQAGDPHDGASDDSAGNAAAAKYC